METTARNNNATNAASTPLPKPSEVVADWLTIYGQMYREEIQPELALAYLEMLKHIPAMRLHQAFRAAASKSKFRPTAAEVREQAELFLAAQPSQPDHRKTCDRCQPDGWVLIDCGGGYQQARRCAHESRTVQTTL